MSPARPTQRYAVLVPVKPPSLAKSRLGALGPLRPDLARAMALDTVAACLAATQVERVLAVTEDPGLAESLRDQGAAVVGDRELAGEATDPSLNELLALAGARVTGSHPRLRVAALCGDLPALRGPELDLVLAAAAHREHAVFLADALGEGTTLLVAGAGSGLRPLFGSGSAGRHRAAGAEEVLSAEVPSCRRDVDRPEDLAAALALGVGPRTREALAAHGYGRSVQGTVLSFDDDTRAGSLVLDDGLRLQFAGSAVDSGLRLLRPGQRVAVRTGDGSPRTPVEHVRILTVG